MNSAGPGSGELLSGLADSPVDAAVLRMRLGSQLRRLREAAGITPERAGFEIRGSRSKISRLENGRVKFKDRDATGLLTFYGVTGEGVRSKFLTLVRQSSAPGWWREYGGILPGWFETYPRLEAAAAAIRRTCLTLFTLSSSLAPSTWSSARTSSATWRSSTRSAAMP
jgi:hypothetical protein